MRKPPKSRSRGSSGLDDPSATEKGRDLERETIMTTAVESSVISRIGYSAATKTLQVEFKSGRIYRYFAVPALVYEGLRTASSVGSYFNTKIRTTYQSEEIR